MTKNIYRFLLITILMIFSVKLFAYENTSKNDITYSDAVILGLVEGITEYLPVSSTGHLILTNSFLGLDSNTPVLDKNGLNVMKSANVPYTIKLLADSYAIIIQIGAIASVTLLYWRSILIMFLGLLGRNPQGLKLFINLCIAFIPAAITGLLFHKIIENILFGVVPVIIALAVGAVVMILVQRKYDLQNKNSKTKIENLSKKQAVIIGLLQCVALIPGTSRSMMTILGGYIAGMSAKDSAKFSFLLGLVTLSAASFYKLYKDGNAMFETLSPSPMILGIAVAFVSSAIAVKWLVNFLSKYGLFAFAVYRLLIATLLLVSLYLNII